MPQNQRREPKILVAGATGYTGREVVRQSAASGVETIAHIRPDSSSRDECQSQFEQWGASVDLTPWEEEAWVRRLAQLEPTHLFFLIGTTKARMRNDGDAGYESIDYGLLAMLLEACAKSGVEPRIIYLSAMGVKAGARSDYYRARWKAEEAIRESGLPYVIARPGMITGPDRPESRPMERFGGWMADAAGTCLRVVGAKELAARVRSTTGEELAAALIDYGLNADDEELIVEAEDLKGRSVDESL